MHGHGGKGIGRLEFKVTLVALFNVVCFSIIPKPWRIVFPSLIFFAVCLVSATVSASRSSEGLNGLCRQFDQIPDGIKLECGTLLAFYSLQDVHRELIPPDRNYYLLASFPWLWVTSYACATVILVLRILLVVDFQLIRVIISTVDPSRTGDLQGFVLIIGFNFLFQLLLIFLQKTNRKAMNLWLKPRQMRPHCEMINSIQGVSQQRKNAFRHLRQVLHTTVFRFCTSYLMIFLYNILNTDVLYTFQEYFHNCYMLQ